MGQTCCNCLSIEIPGTSSRLVPGCKVKLGRFQTNRWVVHYGWYTIPGNRSVCGWYLVDECNCTILKSLQDTDLIDIYILEL